MDGTSGALYSIWSNGLAAGLASAAKASSASSADAAVWAAGLEHALKVLQTYTAARRPSRTLVDPLEVFTEIFGQSKGTKFDEAYKGAAEASEKTKDLVAKAGRAACTCDRDSCTTRARCPTLILLLVLRRCWTGGAPGGSGPRPRSTRCSPVVEGYRFPGLSLIGHQ